MKPKISLLMPIYNAEDTLQQALDSIPLAKDIQVILLDDGSTDNSWEIALDWWRKHSAEGAGSIIHRWEDNKGVAATMNLGFSLATGEYIVSLSADDYYLADFEAFRPYLDGKNDLIYFDLEVNDGSVWHLSPETKHEFVGAVKFIRRDFLGDTRIPDKKWCEDKPFSEALYAKNPKEVFTGIVLKKYNWPHVGSLSWQANHENNDKNM